MKDERLPQTGENLSGEKMSPLKNSPEDFPTTTSGPEALGDTWPTRRSMLENPNPAPGSSLESSLPTQMTHAEIREHNQKRIDWGNLE